MTVTPYMLHQAYRMVSGIEVPLQPEWERRWCRYMDQGYGIEDLQLVVAYLKREIKHERRNKGALLLRNLLEWGPDSTFLRLDEDMALAKAEMAPARPVRPAAPAKPEAPVASQEQLADFARRIREQRERLALGMRTDVGYGENGRR